MDDIDIKIHNEEKEFWRNYYEQQQRKKKTYFEIEDNEEYNNAKHGIRTYQRYVRQHENVTEQSMLSYVKNYVNTHTYTVLKQINTTTNTEKYIAVKNVKRGTKDYTEKRTKNVKYLALAMSEMIRVQQQQQLTNSIFITLTIAPEIVTNRITAWKNITKYMSEYIRFIKKIFGQHTTWVYDKKTGKKKEKTIIRPIKLSYIWTVEAQNTNTHYPHIHLLINLPEFVKYYKDRKGILRVREFGSILKEQFYYGIVDVRAVYSTTSALQYIFKYVYKSMNLNEGEYTLSYCLALGRRSYGSSRDISKRAKELEYAFNNDTDKDSLITTKNNSIEYEVLGVVNYDDIKTSVFSVYKLRRGNTKIDDNPPLVIEITEKEYEQIAMIIRQKYDKEKK